MIADDWSLAPSANQPHIRHRIRPLFGMSDPASSVSSCSWEHLSASVPAGPTPIATRIEHDSLFDWYKPPPTEEHCMWELLSNSRVGIPAVLASNAVLLAIGFFLGRRSLTLDLSFYI